MGLGLAFGLAVCSGPTPDPVIGGVALDLRADAGTTSDVNGVSAWVDQSPNAYVFVQASNAHKPALIPNAYNGLPCLRAADAARGLAHAGTVLASPGTIFLVCTASTASAAFIAAGEAGGGDGIWSSVAGDLDWLNGSDGPKFKHAASAGLHVCALVQRDGVSLVGYFDGVQAFSVVPTSALFGITGVMGDRQFGFASNGLVGDLAHVRCYNTALTPNQVADVQAFLKAKWGTP